MHLAGSSSGAIVFAHHTFHILGVQGRNHIVAVEKRTLRRKILSGHAVQGDQNSAHVPLISRSSDDAVSERYRRDMARVGRQPSLQRRLVVQSTR